MGRQLLETTAASQSGYRRLSPAGKRARKQPYAQLQGILFWGGDLPGSTRASNGLPREVVELLSRDVCRRRADAVLGDVVE